MKQTKWVIISGISRGLGLAMTEALLEAGFDVAGCSTSQGCELAALQNQYKDRFFWSACDMADTDAIEAFVAVACQVFSGQRLWGVINNAGVSVEGVLSTLPVVDIERVIQVNLTGSIVLARSALRRMMKGRQSGRDSGRIINITSITAQRGYTGLSAYAASKAGTEGFTRALAREVGRLHITVNAVAPGYMQTALSSGLDQAQLSQIVRRTPLGRLCAFSDVVAVVQFLLSEAAGFITGQVITVDGGLTK
jgi:3-oxoacyl-[acyl-carrier protein] reductase